MSPILSYTLCPSDQPPTKNQILNSILAQLAEWAQDDFRVWKLIRRSKIQSVLCGEVAYTAEVNAISDIYSIKYK